MASAFSTSQGKTQNQVFCHEGFEYLLRADRISPIGEKKYRCRYFKKYGCTATIVMIDNRIISQAGEHYHMGDPYKVEVHQVQAKIRQAATSSHESTRDLVGDNMVGISDEALKLLPSRNALEETVRAKRRTNHAQEVPGARDFDIPACHQPFILFDSGAGDAERIIGIGVNELLQQLKSDIIIADGTFDTSPDAFMQLYTIHAKVGDL
jgi:hypothetical protein